MLEIPARIYSKAIWETIRYRTKEYADWEDGEFRDSKAISPYTASMLNRVVRFFKPTVIIEIGTGTGRSARAMRFSMPEDGMIYSCDTEVPMIDRQPWLTTFDTLSTGMFKQLTKPADMMFFDGRIQPADIEHIQRLATPECVFAFDDFEGIEKGVANALMIQHLGGILVLPEEGQTLGMMLRQKISLTRQ